MKKFLSILAILVAFIFCGVAQAAPKGYIPIKTAQDLQNISKNLKGKYFLENDIDLSETFNWQPIGTEKNPFGGVLDGNNKTISGLRIMRPDEKHVGLFGYTAIAKIKNFTIKGKITGKEKVGSLIGYSVLTTINNCHSSAKVLGEVNAGNLIGYVNGGSVSNCSSKGSVKGVLIGGLIGYTYTATINDSHSDCYVISPKTKSESAGFIGAVYKSKIKNCYSTGNVSAKSLCSGFIYSVDESQISKCYASGNVVGKYKLGGFSQEVKKSVIKDCFYCGEIKAKGSMLGGFTSLASLSEFHNCYTTAKVPPTKSYQDPNYVYTVVTITQIRGGFAADRKESEIIQCYSRVGSHKSRSYPKKFDWDFENTWVMPIKSGLAKAMNPYLKDLPNPYEK